MGIFLYTINLPPCPASKKENHKQFSLQKEHPIKEYPISDHTSVENLSEQAAGWEHRFIKMDINIQAGLKKITSKCRCVTYGLEER